MGIKALLLLSGRKSINGSYTTSPDPEVQQIRMAPGLIKGVLLMLFSATLIILMFYFSFFSSAKRSPVEGPSNDIMTQSSLPDLTPDTRFWLRGSWGYIVNASENCWVHPRFESFALMCKKKFNSTAPVVIMMQLMPLLRIHGVHCKRCRLPFSGEVVKIQKTDSARLSETDVDNTRAVQDVQVIIPPLSESCQWFAQHDKDEWGISIRGLSASTCMVRFDILASIERDKNTNLLPSVPPVCFAAFGDWGESTPNQRLVINQLRRLMKRHWVKFLVSTGDNFYPSGVQSPQDEAWRTVFEEPFSDEVFHKVPFLISLGNHDLMGKASAQVMYGINNPRWYLPRRSYGITIPLIQKHGAMLENNTFAPEWLGDDSDSCTSDVLDIFVMNSYKKETWTKQVTEGNKFFLQRLRGGYQRWKLVVNHEVVFSGSFHGSLETRNNLFRSYILPFIARHKIHAYLNGDDHLLEVHRYKGTDFITTGAGGGITSYNSLKRLPTTVWRPETTPGMPGDGKRVVLGPTLHCTVPFSTILTTTLYNVSTNHDDIVYTHKTCYGRAC